MKIHKETMEQLNRSTEILEPQLHNSLEKLLQLSDEFSPITDVNRILEKTGVTLESLYIEKNSWIPIRNVLRIIAYIISISNSKVKQIFIDAMECGCDNFKGTLRVEYSNGDTVNGEYKWQWTAFPGHQIHYNKFKIFPKLTIQNPQ